MQLLAGNDLPNGYAVGPRFTKGCTVSRVPLPKPHGHYSVEIDRYWDTQCRKHVWEVMLVENARIHRHQVWTTWDEALDEIADMLRIGK